MQLAIDFNAGARRTDPMSSHRAAERAVSFKAKHEATIFAAISDAGERGATYKEIAHITKMEPVAVARRLSAMGERKLIERRSNGRPDDYVARGGCAVWWRR